MLYAQSDINKKYLMSNVKREQSITMDLQHNSEQ